MALFATTDLRKRLHVKDDSCASLDERDSLRTWYGHSRRWGHETIILLMHAATRFAVVIPAKGVNSPERLAERWRSMFVTVARDHGFTESAITPLQNRDAVGTGMRLARASNKSLLGTMNDWFRSVDWWIEDGRRLNPLQLARSFNRTPLSPLKYASSHEMFSRLLRSLAEGARFDVNEAITAWRATFAAATGPVPAAMPALKPAPEPPPRDNPSTPTLRLTHSPETAPYHGRWRIVEAPYFAAGALECEGPAHITIKPNNRGRMSLCALNADIDVRGSKSPNSPGEFEIRWTWFGDDARLLRGGCGEATVRGDDMRGTIFLHAGDDIEFRARRER